MIFKAGLQRIQDRFSTHSVPVQGSRAAISQLVFAQCIASAFHQSAIQFLKSLFTPIKTSQFSLTSQPE
jgi:hypothetical protein